MRSIKIGYVTNSSNDVAFIVYKTNIIPTVDEIKNTLEEYAHSFLITYMQFLKLERCEDRTIRDLKEECITKLAKTLHEMIQMDRRLDEDIVDDILSYVYNKQEICDLYTKGGYKIGVTKEIDDKMYGPDLAIIHTIGEWPWTIKTALENLGVDVKFLERVHLG